MHDWALSWRADPAAARIADRHYNRQKIGAKQFVPPGRCLVLRAATCNALWVTSWPIAKYVKHRWAGAWVNSLFRREDGPRASDLIREAVAATRWRWPDVPPLGLITFVDPGKTRRKRDPGRCYLRAGFRYAGHHRFTDECEHCARHIYSRGSAARPCGFSQEEGLIALQLLPEDMPPAAAPRGATLIIDGGGHG